MSTTTDWYYIAACLVVPVAWGFVVHVLFEQFGSRAGKARRAAAEGSVAGAGFEGTRSDASDDDLAPEYQI